MSNYWYYTIIFCPQNGVADSIRGALRCAERRGYRAVNPNSGRLTGMQRSGLEELAFDTPEEAVEVLAAQGGLLDFWKDETVISMTFEPMTETEGNGEKKNSTHPGTKRQIKRVVRSLYQISVGVSDSLLRIDRDRFESIWVAEDARSIFLDICETVDARYGYCTDEYLLEFFFYKFGLAIEAIKGQIIEAVLTEGPPAFLFWLQYVSEDNGEAAWLAKLVDMGGMVNKLPKGFSVSFFDWPWEQHRSNEIELINQQWREFYH